MWQNSPKYGPCLPQSYFFSSNLMIFSIAVMLFLLHMHLHILLTKVHNYTPKSANTIRPPWTRPHLVLCLLAKFWRKFYIFFNESSIGGFFGDDFPSNHKYNSILPSTSLIAAFYCIPPSNGNKNQTAYYRNETTFNGN